MPVRAFVSQNLIQLQATLTMLEKALQSGSLEELRIAGVLTRTGQMKPGDVQLRYNQCRYELFLRVQSIDPAKPEAATLQAQFTNPYTEKGMKVHSRSSVGVFGYLVPAPEVPPSP